MGQSHRSASKDQLLDLVALGISLWVHPGLWISVLSFHIYSGPRRAKPRAEISVTVAYMCLLILIKVQLNLKLCSSVSPATLQVLSGHPWLVAPLVDSAGVSLAAGSSVGQQWSSEWRVGGAPDCLSLPWGRPSSDHGDKFQARWAGYDWWQERCESKRGRVRQQEEGHQHMEVKGARGLRMGRRELASGRSGWGHDGRGVRPRGPLTLEPGSGGCGGAWQRCRRSRAF